MKLKVIKNYEAGRKVADVCCLLSWPLHRSFTLEEEEGMWQTVGAICCIEGQVFHEPPCSLQEVYVSMKRD